MPRPKPGTEKPTVSPRERKANGQPKQDTSPARDRSAPALVRRIMDHAVAMGIDARAATVLGRYQLEGIITETDMAAGLLYAETVGLYERVKGHPRRSVASPSYGEGFKGGEKLDIEALRRIDPETADKVEAKIKRRIRRIEKRYQRAQACIPGPNAEAFDEIDDTGRHGKTGIRHSNIVHTVIEEVCCNDLPVHSIYHPLLKNTLRELALKAFSLRPEDAGKPGKRRGAAESKAPDAKHLAEGAVDAMEAWFRKRGASVLSFRISPAQAWQSRVLVAYGRTDKGDVAEHTIKIPRGSLPAELLDATLRRAAIGKEWPEVEDKPIPAEVSAEAIREGISKLKQEGA